MKWITCLDCDRLHHEIARCLTEAEKVSAMTFPCFWAITPATWCDEPYLLLFTHATAMADEEWRRRNP